MVRVLATLVLAVFCVSTCTAKWYFKQCDFIYKREAAFFLRNELFAAGAACQISKFRNTFAPSFKSFAFDNVSSRDDVVALLRFSCANPETRNQFVVGRVRTLDSRTFAAAIKVFRNNKLRFTLNNAYILRRRAWCRSTSRKSCLELVFNIQTLRPTDLA